MIAYDSRHTADFETALAEASTPSKRLGGILHPSSCGPCEDCSEALADYATIPAYREQLVARAKEQSRTFWRRFNAGELVHGTRKVKPIGKVKHSTPTEEQLLRHAERFSSSALDVFEWAEEAGLAGAKLKVKVNASARKAKRSRFEEAKTIKATAEDACELRESGLTPDEIATALGKSRNWVYAQLG